MKTNKRDELVEKLVATLHLNVAERAALTSGSVRYAEVARIIRRILNETEYFPPKARPWKEGSIVHEGAIVQKLPNGRFRLTLQRSHPIAPFVLADQKESEYRFASAAIRAFVRLEWPKGIDGIRITGR